MNSPILGDAAIYAPEAGCFVSAKLQRLAEILKDWDNQLELRWIPPNLRSGEDSLPLAIVHVLPGREPYTVFYFSEADDPIGILARLFVGDNSRKDVVRELDARNAAEEAFRLNERIAEMEEAHDQMHFLMTNRSNNYVNWKVPGTGEIVKLDSERRRVE